MLQAAAALRGFDGNLLILYGDTPLFRAASIRGLLNRHYLKKAHLTLLTAVVDRPSALWPHHPRFANGQIVDIVEDDEASAEVRRIREVNVGAYVVNGCRDLSRAGAAVSVRRAMASTG